MDSATQKVWVRLYFNQRLHEVRHALLCIGYPAACMLFSRFTASPLYLFGGLFTAAIIFNAVSGR